MSLYGNNDVNEKKFTLLNVNINSNAVLITLAILVALDSYDILWGLYLNQEIGSSISSIFSNLMHVYSGFVFLILAFIVIKAKNVKYTNFIGIYLIVAYFLYLLLEKNQSNLFLILPVPTVFELNRVGDWIYSNDLTFLNSHIRDNAIEYLYGSTTIFYAFTFIRLSKIFENESKLFDVTHAVSDPLSPSYKRKIVLVLGCIFIIFASIFGKLYSNKYNTSLTSNSQSLNGISLYDGYYLYVDENSLKNFEHYVDYAKTDKELLVSFGEGSIHSLYYSCKNTKKLNVSINHIRCNSSEDEIIKQLDGHTKYCDLTGDLEIYAKDNIFISFNAKNNEIENIGLNHTPSDLEHTNPYKTKLVKCTGQENDYRSYQKLGYSSVNQYREHKREEEAKKEEYLNFPYLAYLSCGFQGNHINIMACFGGRVDTEMELANGPEYKLYKVWDINRAGQETRDGLIIKLHQNFNIKAQNSSDTLILGLKIVDRSSQEVVFQKQVGRFDVIAIKN